MKRLLLSMIVASLIVSNSTVFIQAKEKNSTKNNIQVSISKNISNEYVTRDPVYDLNDKSVNRAESDFFAPLILNSNWYFPHQKNWYNAWPILLYITENPDGINGLGMDFMYKLLHDKGNETMFEKIERLSGQPLKEILAGYTRRMVTMDFSRQSHYLKYLDEQIKNGNYDKIYSSLEPVGDGYYDLSKLKIRYYYRASDYNAENIWIDTAAGMFTTDPWYLNILTNVKTKFVNMDHYEGNNNSYVEFSFDTAFMVDSSATFKINFRLAKKDWSNFYIDPNSNEANNIVVYYEK